MFDVDSVSSGDPPTSRRTGSAFLGSSAPPSVINPETSLTSERVETSARVSQEPDSGYEASPSSTAGNDNFSFDRVHADPEYDDRILTRRADSESLQRESQSDNLQEVTRVSCPECGPVCNCYYNTSSVSNRSSSGLSGERPSSLPIAIPVRSNFCGYLPLSSHITRSNPVSNALETLEQRPYSVPLSWPSLSVLGASRAGRLWPVTLPPWENIDGGDRNGCRRAAPDRSRRRLIDSDASSLSSSQGEGPEDVFDAEEDSLPTLAANTCGPATVTGGLRQEELSEEMAQNDSPPRNRSVSVNLPPLSRSLEETIVDVGRSLRRLSDDFSRRRQAARIGTNNRRFTIGDFVHYPSVSSNNQEDSDEDFSSNVLDQT